MILYYYYLLSAPLTQPITRGNDKGLDGLGLDRFALSPHAHLRFTFCNHKRAGGGAGGGGSLSEVMTVPWEERRETHPIPISLTSVPLSLRIDDGNEERRRRQRNRRKYEINNLFLLRGFLSPLVIRLVPSAHCQ